MAKMEALIAAPGWMFRVLCPEETPDEIMGLLVYRPPQKPGSVVQSIAWVYVKDIYRQRGVARALLQHARINRGEVHCPFVDPEVAKRAAMKGWRLRFRPYLPDVAIWEASR
jgi:GNAT superfamily N-acetyltransferase